MRVSGWSAAAVHAVAALADVIAVPDSAFDGAALLVSIERGGIDAVSEALLKTGASIRSIGPRRQSRDPLYGAPRNDRSLPFGYGTKDESNDCDASPTAARRARYRGLCARQEQRAGRSPRYSSCRRTRRRSGRARARSRPTRRAPTISRITRTARRANCARRSAGRSDSIPTASSAAPGSDDLLHLLAHAYLVDGDEAIHTTHGFLIYPIVTLGTGAKPVVAPEKDFTADVDAILAAVTEQDQNRLSRQPEQSDRHLPVVRRGQAAAPRPAGQRAAGARRRLCRICPAQRL